MLGTDAERRMAQLLREKSGLEKKLASIRVSKVKLHQRNLKQQGAERIGKVEAKMGAYEGVLSKLDKKAYTATAKLLAHAREMVGPIGMQLKTMGRVLSTRPAIQKRVEQIAARMAAKVDTLAVQKDIRDLAGELVKESKMATE